MSWVTVSAIVEADPRVGPTTRRTGHTSFAWSDSPPSRLVECGKTRLADHRLNTRIAACRTFPDTGGGAACDLSDARPRALRPRGDHRVGTTREHGNSPADGAPRGPGQGHPLRSRSRPNAAVQQAVALLSRPSDQLRRPGSRHNWTLCCWGGPPTHSHSTLHHAQVSPRCFMVRVGHGRGGTARMPCIVGHPGEQTGCGADRRRGRRSPHEHRIERARVCYVYDGSCGVGSWSCRGAGDHAVLGAVGSGVEPPVDRH